MNFKFNILIFLGLAISISTFAQTNRPNKNWKQVRRCDFTFAVPKSLKEMEAYEVDSCVGAFEDENVKVTFDYGWYGGKTEKRDYMLDYQSTGTGINGKKGQLATYIFDNKTNYPPDKKYITRIYVEVGYSIISYQSIDPKLKDDVTPISLMMTIEVKNKKDLKTARRIFKSIKF